MYDSIFLSSTENRCNKISFLEILRVYLFLIFIILYISSKPSAEARQHYTRVYITSVHGLWCDLLFIHELWKCIVVSTACTSVDEQDVILTDWTMNHV